MLYIYSNMYCNHIQVNVLPSKAVANEGKMTEVGLTLQLFKRDCQILNQTWAGQSVAANYLRLSMLYIYVQKMDAQLFSEYTGQTQGAD